MTHDGQLSVDAPSCFGFCHDCDVVHMLPVGSSGEYVKDMMLELEALGRLDYLTPADEADPRLHFNALFDGKRGHMFGAMECRDEKEQTVWLRAFSSLKGGIRRVAGWAPPILPQRLYQEVLVPGEAELVRMTAELETLPQGGSAYHTLFRRRRALSQSIMAQMHATYRFRSLTGETRSLSEAFLLKKAPGGVGECCAPKLLQWASNLGLQPVSIAEIYWGGTPPTASKQAGHLYACCESRCQPLMGFMLCGGDYVKNI